MAPHRYWRVLISKSTSGADNLISLYEVEMRASVGGVDQCIGGSASAAHATASAGNLFDDDNGTYWVNGGPSELTWVQYDFGSGNEVTVRELALMPRYANQSPEDFKLQYADDGAQWTDAAEWSGIGGWSAFVYQYFTVPGPPVAEQNDHPFAMVLGGRSSFPFDLGLFRQADRQSDYDLLLERAGSRSYGLALARGLSQPFDRWLESPKTHSYSIRLGAGLEQPWNRHLSAYCQQPVHDSVMVARGRAWSLWRRLAAQRSQPVIFTVTVRVARGGSWSLLPLNPLVRQRRGYWDLAVPTDPVIRQFLLLAINGQRVPLLSVELRHEERATGWSADLHLARESDFQRLQPEDTFTLSLGDDQYQLLVDRKMLTRDADGPDRRMLHAVSPTAKHAAPRATPITRSWEVTITARSAVEEILSETVDWQLLDWPIAAGRLRFVDKTPLQMVREIVEAVGGVVETTAAGRLRARYRFPLAVPDWETATGDHVVTDHADNLQLIERKRARGRLDRVTVRDGEPEAGAGSLSLILDQRPDGGGGGRKTFHPGGTAHLLLNRGPGVTTGPVAASSGDVIAKAPPTVQIQEDLAFVADNRSRLSRPVRCIDAVVWLGADLGTPGLDADGRTVIVPQIGTAIARITATVEGEAYSYTAPLQVAGLDSFPVLISAVGAVNGAGVRSVTVQRHNGVHPGADRVEPLLSDHRALQARGRQELDLGEVLNEVELTLVHRSGLEPGQLLTVHDGHYGRSFQALITAVRIEAGEGGWHARLWLMKRS